MDEDELLELIRRGEVRLPEEDPDPDALEEAAKSMIQKLRDDMESALHCTSQSGHNWGPVFDGVMRCCVCGTQARVEAEDEDGDEDRRDRGPFGFATL